MGKCISASSEQDNLIEPNTINESGNNNTNNAIDDNKHNKANNNKTETRTTNFNMNAGSLSESLDDDEETEQTNKELIKEKKHVQTEKKSEENTSSSSYTLKYIYPTSLELDNENELELAHISHRGHYLNQCKYSAQNVLQSNESYYISLKSYHFNHYDENDNDWFIFKICSNNLIKITSLRISYALNTLKQQYPSKISVQFMSNNSLKKVLSCAQSGVSGVAGVAGITGWTKPYIIETQDSNTFNIGISESDLNKLKNNKCDQYVRISLIDNCYDNDGNNAYDSDKGKFALHHLKLFGVGLKDKETNKNIILENTVSQQIENKNYKVDIDNKSQCKLSPKPGAKDARVMMREQIFFVNTESKTILKLKQSICDEYNRFTKHSIRKYQPKQLLLIEAEFGLINDMMDCTVLNKTLTDIGVKCIDKNYGYYITVAFC